jgi:putative transposase
MFNEEKLHRLLAHLNLPREARTLIAAIHSAPPSRRLSSTVKSVFVQYASQKMGCVIQARGHRTTLPAIIQMEYDDQVLAFYDQPPPFQIRYLTGSGREVTPLVYPDFFVICDDGAGWQEWRSEKDLMQRARKMANRYIQIENGRWRCPPGEEYASQFGLFYRVHSTSEFDWVFQRNIHFLEDYLRADCPDVDRSASDEILSLVHAEPGINLLQLLRSAKRATPDDIYTLIANRQLFVDLTGQPLVDSERVLVFANRETARAYRLMLTPAADGQTFATPVAFDLWPGGTFIWDGKPWQILNVGESEIALLAEGNALVSLPRPQLEALILEGQIAGIQADNEAGLNAQARAILSHASPADLQEANRRYQLLLQRLQEVTSAEERPSPRTLRRWQKQYREAEVAYGYGYLGLIPQTARRGNRQRKLQAETISLIDEYVQSEYETVQRKSIKSVYDQLRLACEGQGLAPPSYQTFALTIHARPSYEQTKKRQGSRTAYVHEPFHFVLELSTPRHGDRPFELGHLDHTQLDIELVDSETGQLLSRPWYSLLMDAYSRRILALILLFDPPSYRSCLLLLRECVHRFGRLPQTIVVDGGSEFRSTYFETFLALYGVTKKTRPQAKGRFGSVIERLFSTTNEEFVHNLIGNTQNTRQVRELTRATNPKAQAVWSLPALYPRLCEWSYEIYDQETHTALGQSPRDAFTQGLAENGRRLHRRIPYNQDFIMTTLPTTAKGTARVQPNRGVYINHLYYWTEAFRDRQVENTQVPVRYDPFNAGAAYTFVHGRWHVCISEHYAYFRGRSEREIKVATGELRRRSQRSGQSITSKKLADFLRAVETEELLWLQQRRDREARQSLGHLTDNLSAGVEPPARATVPATEDDPPSNRHLDEEDKEPLPLFEDF